QLAAIPGARSVTAASVELIAGDNSGGNITIEGFKPPDGRDHSMYNNVGAGFFGKMGIPLIAGRDFTEQDTLGSPKVAVVNEAFVRRFSPNGNPIGRKFISGGGNVVPDIEIVGVAKDSKYSGVKQKTPEVYYLPWRQTKDIGALSFYVRTALDPAQTIPQIRSVMAALDRDLPLEGVRTLDDQVRRNIRSDRLTLQLAAAFAILATLMAMLGLYGVMA